MVALGRFLATSGLLLGRSGAASDWSGEPHGRVLALRDASDLDFELDFGGCWDDSGMAREPLTLTLTLSPTRSDTATDPENDTDTDTPKLTRTLTLTLTLTH